MKVFAVSESNQILPAEGEAGADAETIIEDVSVAGANLDPIKSQNLIRASARRVNFNAGNRSCRTDDKTIFNYKIFI